MSFNPLSDVASEVTHHAATAHGQETQAGVAEGCDISVTILVSRRIQPGCEEAYEEKLRELKGLLEKQPGFCEMKAYKPGVEGDEHKVMLRFASGQELEAWQQSKTRQQWMKSVKPLEATPPRAHVLTGLETWFTLPEQEGLKPPPAHKMGFLTWIGIFPLVAISNGLIVPHINTWPLVLQAALTTAITVSLMTYVVMPRLTRLFARFLYPEIELSPPQKVES